MTTTPFDGLGFARSLPHDPGIYRYYDAADRLLYVGKARDLQRRVASYFQKTPEDPRIAAMVSQVVRADFAVVGSEVDALVLESRLIKEQRPHFNLRLRDGHGYPYLHLSSDKPVPQLTVHRGKRGGPGRFFGPFPSRDAVHQAHDLLQRHFGLRTCSDSFFSHRSRPCLEYQLGRCSAPCVGLIDPAAYRERVNELEALLDGRSSDVADRAAQRMEAAAHALDFEAAALWRDRLGALRQIQAKLVVEAGEGSFDAVALAMDGAQACAAVLVVREGQVVGARTVRLTPPAGEDAAGALVQFVAQRYLAGEDVVPAELLLAPQPNEHDRDALAQALSVKTGRRVAVSGRVRAARRAQLALAERNAQAGLAAAAHRAAVMAQRREALAALLGLQAAPERIECFDISHTQGEAPVASCVVFGPEGPLKSAYRRYNVRGVTPGDDYAAIRQVVERRLTGPEPPPDLMLIDGGSGQVAQAVAVARGLSFGFPIVGVSKGPDRRAGEEALIVDDGRRVLRPGSGSAGLHLIQAVRDEAHRFALRSHRQRRDKARSTSALESIAGVGPARRRALLQAFGGLAGLKRASPSDIAQVPGIGTGLARSIADALR